MIKGIYGFACVLLRLGPLLDGQSRLVYKKIVVVAKFLIFWIWYLIFEIKLFICIFFLHSFSRENTKCSSLCLVQQQKVTAIFLKENWNTLSLTESAIFRNSSILVWRGWHTDWSTNQSIGLYWCELNGKQSNLTF